MKKGALAGPITRVEHDMAADRPRYVQIDLDVMSRRPFDPLLVLYR